MTITWIFSRQALPANLLIGRHGCLQWSKHKVEREEERGEGGRESSTAVKVARVIIKSISMKINTL